MTESLQWIRTNGGPLVLVPGRALSTWQGEHGTSEWNENRFTDYGRAGQVEGYAGIIDCGGHQVAVIGDEPSETTWLPFQFSSGIIAKWTYAPSDQAAEVALARLADRDVVQSLPWHGEKVLVHVADRTMLLFDAAIMGQKLKATEFIEIPVQVGTLEIRTAIYEPNEEISFVVHSIDMLKLT